MAYLNVVECNIVQCSLAVEEEEESSHPFVECEVPRELLLHRNQLMPPLEIRFERFEENILIVQQFQNRNRIWNRRRRRRKNAGVQLIL